MLYLNDDLLRAMRRFDAAGRPMTPDIGHRLAFESERREQAPAKATPGRTPGLRNTRARFSLRALWVRAGLPTA